MARFSICIPTWEQGGLGLPHLQALLASIEQQTFPRDAFEVVISDHSQNREIEDLIQASPLPCTYVRNTEYYGNGVANLNHALGQARGEIIKVMFQDDLFFSPDALTAFDAACTPDVNWAVCGCNHTPDGLTFGRDHVPRWNDEVPTGYNTIHSPSVLAFRNRDIDLFDENLVMLMDCEYYYQLFKRYGLPRILPELLVTNREHPEQITKKFQGLLDGELKHIRKKHDLPKMNPGTLSRTELLNHLVQVYGYRSYLEIGINTPDKKGYNWCGMNVEIKHGVDPNVDTTFRITSDDFFANHIPHSYDLIFVDGLHLHEQVTRDIHNALLHLNEGGTVVVHDCNPYSELTQRRFPVTSAWHGDGWKAIVKLRMEEPDLDIVTVATDEGCTVIRKGHQDLLPVSKEEDPLDYGFLQKHRKEALNLISAEEFLKRHPIKKRGLLDRLCAPIRMYRMALKRLLNHGLPAEAG
jgi:glycosyltransferase involved in cell wall biosynthesis